MALSKPNTRRERRGRASSSLSLLRNERERERWQKGKRGLLGPGARIVERWKERRKRKGSPRCWYRRGPGLGMSAGRRFMWLLIESFSLDRAACFLRSRDSLRSSLLLLLPSSPCCSPSRCCPPLSFALFPSGSIRLVDRTPRFQTVMVREVS